MSRVRIGVVLLLEEPWRSEVNGLRRALGDRNLERIPPHITVVSPVNVKSESLQSVFDNARRVASTMQPFSVQIGPVTTFAPKTPVIKLDVSGEHRATVERLRQRIAIDALDREPVWPFDPHVTLHDDAPDDVIAHALTTLKSYEANVPFAAVWILSQGSGGVWTPIFDARFETPVTIGTGGLQVSLSTSTLLEPAATEALSLAEPEANFAVTARIHDEVAGALVAQTGSTFRLLGFRVAEGNRGQGVGTQLLRQGRYLAEQMGFREIVDDSRCPDVAGLLRRFPDRLRP